MALEVQIYLFDYDIVSFPIEQINTPEVWLLYININHSAKATILQHILYLVYIITVILGWPLCRSNKVRQCTDYLCTSSLCKCSI